MMIYKYYAPREYNLEALRKEYFWFSKRRYQNDPFDMCAEVIENFQKFKGGLEKLGYRHDSYLEFVNMFATCSFSKSGTNKHLWALYADSYRGWCLEFVESDDMVKGTFDKRLYDMAYIDQFPDLDDFETDIPNYRKIFESTPINELLRNIHNKGGEQLFHYLLCVKEKSIWGIEEEKRMILARTFLKGNENDANSAGYKVFWQPSILKRIIVGHNVSNRKMNALRRIANKKGVELWKTKISTPKTFSIKLEKVE